VSSPQRPMTIADRDPGREPLRGSEALKLYRVKHAERPEIPGCAIFRRMGDTRQIALEWLVKGQLVGLVAPQRERFIAMGDDYGDPRIAMIAAFQTVGGAGIFRPPLTREHREALWEHVASGELLAVEVRAMEDGRVVGEAGISRVRWPSASGDIAVVLFDPDDRGRGYGTETVLLLLAYGFDALGLNRLVIRYLSINEAVVRAVERTAAGVGGRLVGIERNAEWAYGAPRDRLIVEFLAGDFPPHPATAALRA
jgi:RimJ/RimL family protein N-acetyltransferase